MTGFGSRRIALLCSSLACGLVHQIPYAAASAIATIPQPIVVSGQD